MYYNNIFLGHLRHCPRPRWPPKTPPGASPRTPRIFSEKFIFCVTDKQTGLGGRNNQVLWGAAPDPAGG